MDAKRSTLLVVEDDGLIRMDIVDMLDDNGFHTLEAANADAALNIFEGNSEIAALLTDIDMPGSMNGIDLARFCSEKWPDCKIIVISGRYVPAQGSVPAGTRFLTKPISEGDLSRALEDMGISP